jgi:hypothetical protein
MQKVSYNGKQISLDKFITASLIAPKGILTEKDIEELTCQDTAVVSAKTKYVIYVLLNGRKQVIVKPNDVIQPGTSYAFLSKMIVKKITDDSSYVIDTEPIKTEPRREPYRNTSKPRQFSGSNFTGVSTDDFNKKSSRTQRPTYGDRRA